MGADMNIQRRPFRQRGMMLLEVMIGILIFAVGVLGMVKLRAVSSANSVNSEDRTTAALLANDLIAELWVTKSASAPADYGPATTAGTWQYRVGHALPDGTGSLTTGTGTNSNVATITIQWSRRLGRNVDFGAAANDSNNTATYTTKVVIQ